MQNWRSCQHTHAVQFPVFLREVLVECHKYSILQFILELARRDNVLNSLVTTPTCVFAVTSQNWYYLQYLSP